MNIKSLLGFYGTGSGRSLQPHTSMDRTDARTTLIRTHTLFTEQISFFFKKAGGNVTSIACVADRLESLRHNQLVNKAQEECVHIFSLEKSEVHLRQLLQRAVWEALRPCFNHGQHLVNGRVFPKAGTV